MRHSIDSDHVVSQGTFRDGRSRLDYYTTVPTPSQWIAVGVLVAPDTEDPIRRPRRMLVGTGDCENDAVSDLEARFVRLQGERKPVASRQGKRVPTSIQQKSDSLRREVADEVVGDPRIATESDAPRA